MEQMYTELGQQVGSTTVLEAGQGLDAWMDQVRPTPTPPPPPTSPHNTTQHPRARAT